MDLLHVYDVTCPESTPVTAPVEVECVPAGLYVVTRVTIVIPDGHSGLTGIALAYGHQPVIPFNPGAWISGNDEIIPYDLGNYPAGVAWSVFLVNGDLQPHAWETRWQMGMLATPVTVGASTPLAPSDIYAAGAASLAGP